MKKARTNPIGETLMLVNPRRRRHHKRKFTHHYRHNPAPSLNRGLALLKPAFVGASGALATNFAFNYLGTSVLPASLTTGPMSYPTKAVLAIGLGMVAHKVAPRHALQMTEGALTVIATQALQYLALSTLGINLAGAGRAGGVGFINPARVVSGAGKFLSSGTGKYVSGAGRGRDYMQAGSKIIPLR